MIKYNWKKIPLTWGTVPGQMVVRVQKVKSTGHIPGRSLGNDDSSPPAYTTVGVTRRRTSNFHHNNESSPKKLKISKNVEIEEDEDDEWEDGSKNEWGNNNDGNEIDGVNRSVNNAEDGTGLIPVISLDLDNLSDDDDEWE